MVSQATHHINEGRTQANMRGFGSELPLTALEPTHTDILRRSRPPSPRLPPSFTRHLRPRLGVDNSCNIAPRSRDGGYRQGFSDCDSYGDLEEHSILPTRPCDP